MNCRLTSLAALLLVATVHGEVSFNQDVRPILSDKCFHCHGPDAENQKGDLRLDLRDAAIEAGAITPGSPETSGVINRIHDTEDPMPPVKSKLFLTDTERATLAQWITEGAEFEPHWAFVPLPDTTSVPDPGIHKDWVKNPIDHFVATKFIAENLSPQPEAPAHRLERRLSFDLTGLPPTSSISQLPSSDFVNSLLATKSFGERMANEWLDVARYADTFGFQTDNDRTVWPWRDWVISAFNDNLPYNDFITWQLAGDLLPAPTHEQILATTFGRLHQQKTEGGSVEEEFRIEYVADRTHTFGTAFLGLTLECARCHDHKYDPISQKEYYQLTAYFNSIDEAGLYPYGHVKDNESMPTPTLDLNPQPEKIATLEEQSQNAQSARDALDTTEAYQQWLTSNPTITDLPDREAAAEIKDGKLINLLTDKPIGVARNTFEDDHLILTGDDEITLPMEPIDRHEPFTAHLEIRPTQRHERAVILHRTWFWTDSASRGYEITILDGKLNWSLIHYWPGNAASIQATTELPLNEWANITVTSDGSSNASGLAIHINGQKIETEIIRDGLTKTITSDKAPKGTQLAARGRDSGFLKGHLRHVSLYRRQLSGIEIAHLNNAPSVKLSQSYYNSAISPEYRTAQTKLNESRAALSKHLDGIRQIMVMRETPEPRPTYLLARGAYDARGERLERAVPQWLQSSISQLPSPKDRLGLSKWLTSPNHPLTARVTVNRYWQMFFGYGLVATSEDFGSQGSAPTHPRLLDWLARDFIDSGWDVKHLCRLITNSATYRQDSNAPAQLLTDDPTNFLLARGPSHRLSAEMIRDHALASSGLLADKVGGPPVRPYDLSESFKPSTPDKGEGLYRRSLYTYWKRTAPSPAMMAFDAVKRDVCMVRREPTATPLQALVLLNGTQFVEAARSLAENTLAESDTPEAAITIFFKRLTNRPPTDQESTVLSTLWETQKEYFTAHPEEASDFLTNGEHPPSNSISAPLLAAATTVAQTILNLDESVSKR